MDNCPIKLLNQEESDLSECSPKTKQQLIKEYKVWEEDNKSETSSQWELRKNACPAEAAKREMR